MKDKDKEIGQNNLYWVYLTGFFLILILPLLNLPPWFSPPDWGKTIVFRIVLSVLIFLFIYQTLYKKTDGNLQPRVVKLLSKKSAVFWPFCLLATLLGIFFLATIFSKDIRFSLWGSPYRSGGFINFAFYIIFSILVFLIIKRKDWQKIWFFSFFIGILVALIAILQQFGLLRDFFISFETRPPSTIGGPIFLAIYLLLLSFLSFDFGIEAKKLPIKIFCFSSFLLFVSVIIFVTQTRAAMIGLAVGFLYFILLYPTKKIATARTLKVAASIIVILGIYGIYLINTLDQLPQFINENKILRNVVSRLSIEGAIDRSRISAWRVSFHALKERPLLGYGPENFSIGFDKYYNPSLPGIKHPASNISWWDRAHNFIFDIAVTAGIPALLIYLSLFGVLFWQLQRLKHAEINAEGNADKTRKIAAHGIQTTFIAYLTANFFSFDTFSTYLIFFLLVGYSLHLISSNATEDISVNQRGYQREIGGRNWFQRLFTSVIRLRKPIIAILGVLLIWFLWQYNIKPFQANTQINVAKYLTDEREGCEKKLNRIEKILKRSSFVSPYIRLKYTDFLKYCESKHPEKTLEYATRGTAALKENLKAQPLYTRNWILAGGFVSVLIEQEKDTQKKQELIKEANSYFEQAQILSPKRQQIFIEWTKHHLVSQNYQNAKEKAGICIDLNPELGDCYWFLGISEIFLGNKNEGEAALKKAEERGYPVLSLSALNQLAEAHTSANNYQELVRVYMELIKIKPSDFRYHATLAFLYRNLGSFERAREEARRVLELSPESREEVEEFLKTFE